MNGIITALNRLIEVLKTFNQSPSLNNFSNTSRPTPTTVSAGYMIFNTDDNFPNVSDGTNWRDMSGTIT